MGRVSGKIIGNFHRLAFSAAGPAPQATCPVFPPLRVENNPNPGKFAIIGWQEINSAHQFWPASLPCGL
jgi:hypothetical protein